MAVGIPIEVLFTLALAAFTGGLAAVEGLPLVTPTSDAAAFVGIHYLFPAVAATIWMFCAVRGGMRTLGSLVVSLGCLVVVLWLHFNLKLWVPLLDIPYHDAELHRTDHTLAGVVGFAFAVRARLSGWLPAIDHLYFWLFIALFWVGFCVHALHSPERFRKVLLAVLFFQGIGGLSYLVYPALGPFVSEQGLNPVATSVQASMLEVTRAIDAGGPAWLEAVGGHVLFTGLGAMPSLHAGGAFLFLWFSWIWERRLFPLHLLVFLFILVGAVASRWHYVIDLPVGIALACLSISLAFRLDGVSLKLLRRSAG